MPHFVDVPHVPLFPPIYSGFSDTFDPDTSYYTYLSPPSACFDPSSFLWLDNMAPKASRIAPETPQKRRPIIACQRCRKRKIKCDPGEDGAPCLTCKQGNVSDSCKYFRVGSEDAQTLLEDTRVKGLDAFKDPTQAGGRHRKAARTSLITSPSHSERIQPLSSPNYEHHRHSLSSPLDRSHADYGPIMYMPAVPQYHYGPRTASLSSPETQRTDSLMSFHSSSYSSNDTLDDNDCIHLQPLQHISINDPGSQQTARRTLPPISTTIAFPPVTPDHNKSVNDRSCKKQPQSYCNISTTSPRGYASTRDHPSNINNHPRPTSQLFGSNVQSPTHYQNTGASFQPQGHHQQQQQQHRPHSQHNLDYLASVATLRAQTATEPAPSTQAPPAILPGFNSLVNWGPGYAAAAQYHHGATHNHNQSYQYSPTGYGPSPTSTYSHATTPSTAGGQHHHFGTAPLPSYAPAVAPGSAPGHGMAQHSQHAQQPQQMYATSPGLVGYGRVQSFSYGPTLSAVRSAMPQTSLAGSVIEGVGSDMGRGGGSRGIGRVERNRTRP